MQGYNNDRAELNMAVSINALGPDQIANARLLSL